MLAPFSAQNKTKMPFRILDISFSLTNTQALDTLCRINFTLKDPNKKMPGNIDKEKTCKNQIALYRAEKNLVSVPSGPIITFTSLLHLGHEP